METTTGISALAGKHRFSLLLVLMLGLIFVFPAVGGIPRLKILVDVYIAFVFLVGVYSISSKRHFAYFGLFLALPKFITTALGYIAHVPGMVLVGDVFGILCLIFIAYKILVYVFKQQRITGDIISGMVVIYLLLAYSWALIFQIIEVVQPGSFYIPEACQQDPFSFLYFSLVTITTIGYGDITPVSNIAKACAVMNGLIGQIYLVVVVATLVGMRLSQSMQSDQK
jgi:voltage-gated potassium channel